ncbi:MAG: GNAT family N-acetyltransferase [Pirellulaceae bacterium]
MHFRRFIASDFEEYQSWFSDPEILRWLGPAPDAEWLNHVLNDTEGAQFVGECNGVTQAVIGVIFASETNRIHVITDFAVHPSWQRTGTAQQALKAVETILFKREKLPIVTYIDQQNLRAIGFFTKSEYVRFGAVVDQMVELRKVP